MRRAVSGQADLIAISPDRTDITWSTDEEMEKAHVVWTSGRTASRAARSMLWTLLSGYC